MRLKVGRLLVLVIVVATFSAAYHYYTKFYLSPFARFTEGTTKLRLGDLAGAEKEWRQLERLTDLAPTQRSALQERFSLLEQCRRLSAKKARAYVNKALTICRHLQPAIDEERLTQTDIDKLQEALGYLELAAMYRNSDARYGYLVAYVTLHLGLLNEAAPLVKAVAEANPTSADTVVLLAIYHEQIGDLEEAISALLGALQINPNHRWANYYLATYLIKNGEGGQQAFEAAQKAAITDRVWAKKLATLFAPWPEQRKTLEQLAVQAASKKKVYSLDNVLRSGHSGQ